MTTTPRRVIESVVGSVCEVEIRSLVRLTGGGRNEAYRAEPTRGEPLVVRIARESVPWFAHEAHVMAQARGVGVPTPHVHGVEHVQHEGELLSVSVSNLMPGRPLDELVGVLPASTIDRLVMDAGELLARLHSIVPDRGVGRTLEPPSEQLTERSISVAAAVFGAAAVEIVERGARQLGNGLRSRPPPRLSLAHGDWLPKHFLIGGTDACADAIVGVIDWEFAGPASPAFDLAHWEVAARSGLHVCSDLLRRGYARVADPEVADAGWVPLFAIDFALQILSWQNPAPREGMQRCVDVIASHLDS